MLKVRIPEEQHPSCRLLPGIWIPFPLRCALCKCWSCWFSLIHDSCSREDTASTTTTATRSFSARRRQPGRGPGWWNALHPTFTREHVQRCRSTLSTLTAGDWGCWRGCTGSQHPTPECSALVSCDRLSWNSPRAPKQQFTLLDPPYSLPACNWKRAILFS